MSPALVSRRRLQRGTPRSELYAPNYLPWARARPHSQGLGSITPATYFFQNPDKGFAERSLRNGLVTHLSVAGVRIPDVREKKTGCGDRVRVPRSAVPAEGTPRHASGGTRDGPFRGPRGGPSPRAPRRTARQPAGHVRAPGPERAARPRGAHADSKVVATRPLRGVRSAIKGFSLSFAPAVRDRPGPGGGRLPGGRGVRSTRRTRNARRARGTSSARNDRSARPGPCVQDAGPGSPRRPCAPGTPSSRPEGVPAEPAPEAVPDARNGRGAPRGGETAECPTPCR